MKASHHIAGFHLSCAQGCIKPRWFDAGLNGGNAETVEAVAKNKRCPRRGEPMVVEAVFAGLAERLTPPNNTGRKRDKADPNSP